MTNMITQIVKRPLVAGVVGSGITWLGSRFLLCTTKPLVGGAVAGGAMLVSLIALNVFKKTSKLEKWAGPVLDISMFVLPICFAMIATAIGYSFSIPLALLLTASNVAIQLFTN